jgi:hypothetical protein
VTVFQTQLPGGSTPIVKRGRQRVGACLSRCIPERFLVPINERDRIRFHGWRVRRDLDEEVADAIMATMPPRDWHERATKADLVALEERMISRFALLDIRLDHIDTHFNGRFGQVDGRFGQVDRRLDQTDERIAGMALEIRAIMFMLIGLIVSVLLAGAAAMFG